MAVEFYMTNGQFLAIGQLVCSGCKAKSLKGLDFSNSYIIPDVGLPLNGDLALPIKKEAEDEVEVSAEEAPVKKVSVHRDVVLPAASSPQGDNTRLYNLNLTNCCHRKVGYNTTNTTFASEASG